MPPLLNCNWRSQSQGYELTGISQSSGDLDPGDRRWMRSGSGKVEKFLSESNTFHMRSKAIKMLFFKNFAITLLKINREIWIPNFNQLMVPKRDTKLRYFSRKRDFKTFINVDNVIVSLIFNNLGNQREASDWNKFALTNVFWARFQNRNCPYIKFYFSCFNIIITAWCDTNRRIFCQKFSGSLTTRKLSYKKVKKKLYIHGLLNDLWFWLMYI